MSGEKHTSESLSGVWSGRYWYASPDLRIPATIPFTASILERDGGLTGTTLEPNSFAMNDLHELTAEIEGSREADVIDFVKMYDALPGVHQNPIVYTGSVDADRTRIVGGWAIRDDLADDHGGFELSRATSASFLLLHEAIVT